MYLVFVLYALFASVFIIGKTVLGYSQPFFLVGTRMLFAGLALLFYLYFVKGERIRLSKRDIWLVCCLALFGIYLTNTFEFWGLQYLTTFKTCFIYSLSPFLSALISFFVFSEKLGLKKWMGLVIGFLGFGPILFAEGSAGEEVGQILFFSWPEMALLVAATSSVYGWIILKQLVQGDKGHSPMMVNGLSMAIGGFFALLHSYFVENWDPLPITEYKPFLECTVALIVVSNLICYNLYGYLLKKYSATFMSLAGFTTPLFTALFGWIFLDEVVTWPFYASAVVVFSGLLLFNQEELQELTLVTNPQP